MHKLVFTLCTILSFAKITAQDIIHPQSLTVEFLQNPEGIDVVQPRFAWYSTSNQKNQFQSAYQIVVSTDSSKLNPESATLWNSGKVLSNESNNITYLGKSLTSATKAYWRVKVWDKNEKESEWSKIATFSIGLLLPSDWTAQWIGLERKGPTEFPGALRPILSGRMFRKETKISKVVKKATLFVSAAGLYEFYINGSKVGNAVLTPALSQTEKRMFYNTYDVSAMLKTGANAFGAILGAGRFTCMRPLQEATGEWTFGAYKPTDTLANFKIRYPKFIAQIKVDYVDGSSEWIRTDASWKVTTEGPITRNNEYDGETYDARKEQKGWNMPGFDDRSWQKVDVTPAPTPLLSAENKEPIMVNEVLKPKSIKQLRQGVYILDMGQNMVGWLKVKVKGPKGATVKMVFSEILRPDGSLYLDNMRTAEVTDYYILKGASEGESWEPRFVYHGFRYVEISGFPGEPTISDFEGKVVYDAVPTIGDFSCSNPTMSQLFKNAYWGIRGNYRSMPTDCPQRDERFGWLGDRANESKGESYIFRNVNLHRKWMQDIRDAMTEAGSVPDVAPTHNGMIMTYNDGVVWPSCFIIIPAIMYQQTGDKSIISNNYNAFVKWAKHMISYMENDLIGRNTYGDWCMPPESLEMIFSQDPKRITAGGLLSSAYLYHDFMLIANFAKLLGKADDVAFFTQKAQAIKVAFNKVYLNTGSNQYDNNTLSCSLLPLGMGLAPAERKDLIFQNLIQRLVEVHDTKMGTGLIGGQWLMKTLSNNGRPDLAYTLATNTKYPSWGYQITQGATTIWELWNGDKARPDMNSGNHVMLLGDVITWLFENVAGIQSDSLAFKTILLKPDFTKKLDYAQASHLSMYGPISSSWKWNGTSIDWSVQIPVNTKASLFLPTQQVANVLVDGQAVSPNMVINDNNKLVLKLGSGTYQITIREVQLPSIKTVVFSPNITPKDTMQNLKSTEVRISSSMPVDAIYYTLDGSEPTKSSTLYTKPFGINQSTLIKAKAYTANGESNTSTSKISMVNNTLNGWNYSYYEGKWTMLPDFDKEKALKKGTCFTFSPEKIANRDDNYGIVYEAYFKIDADDEYTFYITSDDGSRLIIDQQTIATMDGTHAPQTATGTIALKKGTHKIQVQYFEAIGGQSLELHWQRKGSARQAFSVSDALLKAQ